MPSVKEIYEKITDVTIDADTINLNTDTVESLLSTVQADIALVKTDIANGVLSDLRDGAGNAITSSARGSQRALSVQIVDGSGNQVQPLTDAQLRATAVTMMQTKASTATVTTFSDITSTQVVASNANRLGITIFNSTANVLYIRLGSGAVSSANYSFALGEKELLSLSNITTQIMGIYATSGTAFITELS